MPYLAPVAPVNRIGRILHPTERASMKARAKIARQRAEKSYEQNNPYDEREKFNLSA